MIAPAQQAVVVQLVEHVIGNDEVLGSIPNNGSSRRSSVTAAIARARGVGLGLGERGAD